MLLLLKIVLNRQLFLSNLESKTCFRYFCLILLALLQAAFSAQKFHYCSLAQNSGEWLLTAENHIVRTG